VGPKAGLDDFQKRKFLNLPGLESDSSVVQPVASRHTGCAILAPSIQFVFVPLHSEFIYSFACSPSRPLIDLLRS
jgi:hypothetical protein